MFSGRVERKLFRINDEIARLTEQQRQAEEELAVHRHLHDDAVRDAVVSDDPFDREDARTTADDVARFEALVRKIEERRRHLEETRQRLLEKIS